MRIPIDSDDEFPRTALRRLAPVLPTLFSVSLLIFGLRQLFSGDRRWRLIGVPMGGLVGGKEWNRRRLCRDHDGVVGRVDPELLARHLRILLFSVTFGVLPAWGFDVVFNRDHAGVQGVVLITALAYILLNLLADIAYVLVNPRLRG